MQNEILQAISTYGYLSVFLLIFLQEVGLPNPIPNEFVLLLCGSLCFTGLLQFWPLVLIVVCADMLSSTILFFLFYYLGNKLLHLLSKPFPQLVVKINIMINRLNTSSSTPIVLGRITPFIRGYVSVACGTIRLQQRRFFMIQIATAVIWTLFYLTLGYLLSMWGISVVQQSENFYHLLWQLPIAAGAIYFIYYLCTKKAGMIERLLPRIKFKTTSIQ